MADLKNKVAKILNEIDDLRINWGNFSKKDLKELLFYVMTKKKNLLALTV